jgi:hypothetical protein
MRKLEGQPAHAELQAVAVGQVRIVESLGRDDPPPGRHAKLDAIDVLGVAGHLAIAVEARRHRLVRDEHRARPPAPLGLLEQRPDAERVVQMPVRVDHVADGSVREAADHLEEPGPAPVHAGVDDDQSVAGVDAGRVTEQREQVHALGQALGRVLRVKDPVHRGIVSRARAGVNLTAGSTPAKVGPR